MGWFVGCLLLWIIVFPIYLIVRPKYVALHAAQDGITAGTAQGTPTAGAPAHASHEDIPAQIAALSALHASGALSDTEFQGKKTELLGRK